VTTDVSVFIVSAFDFCSFFYMQGHDIAVLNNRLFTVVPFLHKQSFAS